MPVPVNLQRLLMRKLTMNHLDKYPGSFRDKLLGIRIRRDYYETEKEKQRGAARHIDDRFVDSSPFVLVCLSARRSLSVCR